MTNSQNKLLVDLQNMDKVFRPSVVDNTFVPQVIEPQSSSPIKGASHPVHPISLMFSRIDGIDTNVYTSFNEDVIHQPTGCQILKGWIMIIVSIPLMALGLISYQMLYGSKISISFNISLMFTIANITHALLQHIGCWNSVHEQNIFELKPIVQAIVLKIIRVFLTAFMVHFTYISYVSTQLGYSSHITLILLILKDNTVKNKITLIICIATIIPAAIKISIITTIIGIVMMLAYFKLQLIKQKPYVSSLTWMLCTIFCFLISFVSSIPLQFSFNLNFLLITFFIFLSSKVAKQFLITQIRKCYISQQNIKTALKFTPIVFCIYEEHLLSIYGLLICLAVIGSMISEYTSKIQDDSNCIVFT